MRTETILYVVWEGIFNTVSTLFCIQRYVPYLLFPMYAHKYIIGLYFWCLQNVLNIGIMISDYIVYLQFVQLDVCDSEWSVHMFCVCQLSMCTALTIMK